MKVYLLRFERNLTDNGENGFIVGVYASKADAERKRKKLARAAKRDGRIVWDDPDTLTGAIDWEVNWVVEEHKVTPPFRRKS